MAFMAVTIEKYPPAESPATSILSPVVPVKIERDR